MGTVSKQLDENLAHLAWSLWSELGVAGLKRNHQAVSIAPEELIMLTAVLSEFDPRLRDEALDWCIHYHEFISPIRLHILANKYSDYIVLPFSLFATTVNTVAELRTKWIVLTKCTPLKFRASGKSILRDFKTPSMILFRLRAFFGIGARADVLAFLLNDQHRDFTASDLLETGYSKRRIADILEDLAAAGILTQFRVRNQLRYTFLKRDQFIKLLGSIPKKMVDWCPILDVLLPIRACLQEVEDTPIGVRVIDMRNLLSELSDQLLQIKHPPPPLQNDLEAYWNSITKWILDLSLSLSQST